MQAHLVFVVTIFFSAASAHVLIVNLLCRKSLFCLSLLVQFIIFFIQLLVQAADNGYPARTDLAVVTVYVNRNLNAPIFNPRVYNITILDNRILGDVITTVRATDSDLIVSGSWQSFKVWEC
jgi:hypothetical protein